MVIFKKVVGTSFIFTAAVLATHLAYADPIKYSQGSVTVFQCPSPGTNFQSTSGVSLTLDTDDGVSYKGTIAGVDLVQFISTVQAAHKDWNWNSFPEQPKDNTVSVAALSPYETVLVPAVIGGGTNTGFITTQVFNVGTLDNNQCQGSANNVGINIQLKS